MRVRRVQDLSDLMAAASTDVDDWYVFGVSRATVDIVREGQRLGHPWTAIIDNNEARLGDRVAEVLVIPVAELERRTVLGRPRGRTGVVVTGRHAAAIQAQLEKLTGPFDCFLYDVPASAPNHPSRTFADVPILKDALREAVSDFDRGTKLRETLQSKHNGSDLILCPSSALGDTVMATRYLPEYLQTRRNGRTAIAVVTRRGRRIADLMKTPSVEVPGSEMRQLLTAAALAPREDVIIAHHDQPRSSSWSEDLRPGAADFRTIYRCGVYGLPREAALPAPFPWPEGDVVDSPIVEGNTLVIAPEATSVVTASDALWLGLVADARERGLDCVTVGTAPERALPGTRWLDVPLEQMPSLVSRAGHFVGLRSGICDVLDVWRAEMGASLTVLFPRLHYSTGSMSVAEFFGMPGWREEEFVV